LHLNDNDGSGDFRVPGRGNIDWFAVAKSLEEVSYAGTLNLEVDDSLDWVTWAREGISYLSGVID